MNTQTSTFLYRQVMELVSQSIEGGALRPGDRLPSLRKMSDNAGVSVPTVRQAYVELERLRRIESRPRSGFFVRHVADPPLVRATPVKTARPRPFQSRPLVQRVFDGIDRPDLVPLGIVSPSRAKPVGRALQRTMKRVLSRNLDRAVSYSATLGEPVLRRQLAYHFLDTVGGQVDPEQICITNGAQEALLLALKAVAAPGDVIAVESPTYHGMLELIDSLGMLALEVETCPEEGVTLASLRSALEKHDVRACLFATTLSNPLGVTMPKDCRIEMLEILAENDVVLIEDDVYGELRFDGDRPIPCRFLDPKARVLTCGSFSKTVAPGHRIGWVISDEYTDEIARLKRSFSCTSGMLPQLVLADFLASGDYQRHLKGLQSVLQRNAERMRALVEESFPEGTRVSRPHGGSVLWVQLRRGSCGEELFDRAIEAGISVAPGAIFSPGTRHSNFLRLSFGHLWTKEIEGALRWLGRCAGEV